MTSRKQLRQVYDALGGEDFLRVILRDFYEQMSKDVLIGFFFTGKDILSISENQLQLLLVAMGVNPVYTGKSPHAAHIALPPILKGHFDRRLVLLRETLERHGLSDTHIQTWLDFEEAFRNVVQA